MMKSAMFPLLLVAPPAQGYAKMARAQSPADTTTADVPAETTDGANTDADTDTDTDSPAYSPIGSPSSIDDCSDARVYQM